MRVCVAPAPQATDAAANTDVVSGGGGCDGNGGKGGIVTYKDGFNFELLTREYSNLVIAADFFYFFDCSRPPTQKGRVFQDTESAASRCDS